MLTLDICASGIVDDEITFGVNRIPVLFRGLLIRLNIMTVGNAENEPDPTEMEDKYDLCFSTRNKG